MLAYRRRSTFVTKSTIEISAKAMNITANKILITGGASGIGLGLTERFIQENNTVIICGRREEVLREVAARLPSVITRQCDLSVAAEREALYQWVAAEHADLNVLVNNAGIQQWMLLEDDNFYGRAREELITNIEAPLHLAALFAKLPSLKTIINVTSGLAFAPLANVAVYSATKAFLRSFTLSLRVMLAPKGIEVIEMIPPALNTDLGGKGLHDHAPPVSDFVNAVFEQMKAGKTELTFESSATRAHASQDELRKAFNAMNGVA